MGSLNLKGKTYEVDSQGYLLDHEQWDEDFAQGLAPRLSIREGLTEKHWDVIRYIRESFEVTGDCPLVYQTCRANGLRLKDFKSLFPTGYLRGACLLAGITYRNRVVNYYGEPWPIPLREAKPVLEDKVYRVDVRGFLVDLSEWDENFATSRAYDMKIPGGLSEKHWRIIRYLQDSYEKKGVVPEVFECCEANHIELDELERLFPDGYHRGAVKVAGLRVR